MRRCDSRATTASWSRPIIPRRCGPRRTATASCRLPSRARAFNRDQAATYDEPAAAASALAFDGGWQADGVFSGLRSGERSSPKRTRGGLTLVLATLGLCSFMRGPVENPMPLIVQKFGGTSVADSEKILAAARKAIRAQREGNQVVMVVSAMGTEHRPAGRSGQPDQPIDRPRGKWTCCCRPANRSAWR